MKFIIFQKMNSDTKMEVDNNFITAVKNGLKECNTAHVISLFQEKKHQHDIENNSWDLIPVICEYLTEKVKVENPELHLCCEKLINTITDKANPEECILQMLEEVEEARDDTAFVTLLKPLQTVLNRIKTKRQNSLAWTLNSIKLYVEKIQVPESRNLEGDEKMVMEADPVVDRITRLYLDLLPFYDVLIEELNRTEQESLQERKLILTKFLMHLLGKPLAYLNLEYDGKTKSRARRIVENLCEKIVNLLKDPIILVELEECYNNQDTVYVTSPFVKAVLFYLIFAEHLFIEKVPKVYNPVYVFQTYLYLISALCCENHQFLIEKALKLSDAFVESVKGFELSYQLLDSNSHCLFFKTISSIIIYNPSEHNRKFALAILRKYLDNFEIHGRYMLLYNIVRTIPEQQSSLIGYLITYYKDMLNEALNTEKDDVLIYFTGHKLCNLLNLFCYLHQGEQSDLLELADQIIASLNLLRYLAIRDKTNRTEIWNYFPELDEKFLKPLKKGLLLSRAHYDLKINELNEEMKTNKGVKAKASNVSVTVGGENLSEMPTNEKLKVLNSAMTAFDIMESLLGRLVEIIESH